MHICVVNLTTIVTNAETLFTGPLRSKFNEILIKIPTFSFKKSHLKRSAKWQPFCLYLNVLRQKQNGHHFTYSFSWMKPPYFDSKLTEVCPWGSNTNKLASDKKRKLDLVPYWCCKATSHYLAQCWPGSMPLHAVTRLQWVKAPGLT